MNKKLNGKYDDHEVSLEPTDYGTVKIKAVKSTKVRNLNDEVVETEEDELIAEIPDERALGMEIGKELCTRYDNR